MQVRFVSIEIFLNIAFRVSASSIDDLAAGAYIYIIHDYVLLRYQLYSYVIEQLELNCLYYSSREPAMLQKKNVKY